MGSIAAAAGEAKAEYLIRRHRDMVGGAEKLQF